MNTNTVGLISVGVITGFVVIYKDSQYNYVVLNVHMLILISLATTHYHLSDLIDIQIYCQSHLGCHKGASLDQYYFYHYINNMPLTCQFFVC